MDMKHKSNPEEILMPREKMLQYGKESLANYELLAILINTGTAKKGVLELAKDMLHKVDGNINELGKREISELIKFDGIGKAKAITIAAALELGRRREKEAEQDTKKQLTSSKDAYDYLKHDLKYKTIEEFWVLHLNRANTIVGKENISKGGMTATTADPKVIFGGALGAKATSIILCHNHPSGNLKPSQADIELTKKLVNAGNFLDLKVLDHLIITDKSYYSFADEGMI
jgi:DNA repair protein RadC